MGSSSVQRPSTAVAAMKKRQMQEVQMSSPGSSDKKDEKLHFKPNSSPKLDQAGAHARSSEGMRYSGVWRENSNAD